MAIANLGSIADRVYNLVDNIPTNISGTELINLVYDQVIFAQQFTGLSIGSTAISERFQPALVSLTAGAVQRAKELQGTGKSFTLGDFSAQQSAAAAGQLNGWEVDGREKLRQIGRQFKVYKAYG